MCDHSPSIHGDEEALLGMPYRLLIALISIALVVPAVLSGWSSVDYLQADQRVRTEIGRVLSAAQRYLQAGSGGEIIEIVLEGGTFTRVEYVVFGDSSGQAYSRMARYRLSGSEEQLVAARNPSVAIGLPSGGGLKLYEGRYSIHVECSDGAGVAVWVG